MLSTYLWPCVTAFLAGIINSLAGGGTLLTFPALMASLKALGMTEEQAAVAANATSTIALGPASLSSAWGYRQELSAVSHWLRILAVPSLLGGVLGSLLVTWFPDQFHRLVPWLILLASLLFTIQPAVAKWLGHTATSEPSTERVVTVVVAQFLVATYGGYFGAGIGILMLSALALMGMSNLHEMNALKTVLATLINGTAIAVFAVQDVVHWPLALAMTLFSIVGGYFGARYGRLLPVRYVRYIVIAIGFGLTSYYFAKPWLAPEPATRAEQTTTADEVR